MTHPSHHQNEHKLTAERLRAIGRDMRNTPLFPLGTGISPLSYPGGKYYARNVLRQFLPAWIPELLSPFVGGASMELDCAARGIQVYAYDIHEPVINFWQKATVDPKVIATEVHERHYPLGKAAFYELRDSYEGLTSDLDRAVAFFALNKSGYGGMAFGGYSGGYRTARNPYPLSLGMIQALYEWNAGPIEFGWADFREAFEKHPDAYAYCDPPYMGTKYRTMYGRRGQKFEHEALAEILRDRERWVLSYNKDDTIMEMYKGCPYVEVSWRYSLADRATTGTELVIMSPDMRERLGL